MGRIKRNRSWSLAAILFGVISLGFVPMDVCANLQIEYSFGDGINQKTKDELALAAAAYEANLLDDVVVNVRVEWGDPRFMDDKTASTDQVFLWGSYSLMLRLMVEDEQAEASQHGLVTRLPALADFQTSPAFDPLVFEGGASFPVIYVTPANWKALGLTRQDYFPETEDCDYWGNCWGAYDATIYFNPKYFPYFSGEKADPERGIRDLFSIAQHELGHVLGFLSAGELEMAYDPTTGGGLRRYGPSSLDMYRFGRELVDLADFHTAPRSINPRSRSDWLVLDFSYDTGEFYSKNMFQYRKNNAREFVNPSHWKDYPHPNEIGIMDPGQMPWENESFPPAVVNLITLPDMLALDLIGWDVRSEYYAGEFVGHTPLMWMPVAHPVPLQYTLNDLSFIIPVFLTKDQNTAVALVDVVRGSTTALEQICSYRDCGSLNNDGIAQLFFNNATAAEMVPVLNHLATTLEQEQVTQLAHSDFPVEPVCDAGGTYVGECNESLGLDGTGSLGFEGYLPSYSWSGNFAGGTATGPEPSVIYENVETDWVMLTFDDGIDDPHSCFADVSILDTLAPTVMSPGSMAAECESPAGAPVDPGAASATDRCDGPTAATNDAPAVFPIGTTLVTWTAEDASGNLATATQSVTVVDTTAPTVTPPEDVTAECTSRDGTPVDPGSASATDLCDEAPAMTNDGPAVYPVGTTKVTWTATDAGGNQETADQSVTVVDTTAPTVTPPADVLNAECTSPTGTPVALGTASATDLCDGAPAMTNDDPAVYPVGTTKVTWTATDAGGNLATADQSVTVVDTTPPADFAVAVSPGVLWPPNHKMVGVTTTLTPPSDTCCGDRVEVSLSSIRMNEGDSENTYDPSFDADASSGQLDGDIQVIDGTVFLRAERSGKSEGRVYTLTYVATDCEGNTTEASATVTVPHNM